MISTAGTTGYAWITLYIHGDYNSYEVKKLDISKMVIESHLAHHVNLKCISLTSADGN